jgi:hypothetical protein
MAPVIAHTRKLLDQRAYAVQRPTIAVKTIASCPSPESCGQTPFLLPIESRLSTGSARALQSARPTLLPLLIPTADALAADLKFTGNGGLHYLPSRKILGRTKAPLCHAAEISSQDNSSGRHDRIIKQSNYFVTILCEIF